MSRTNPYLIIAAGGTGGHMFPAQALAEVMLRRGWRVRLSTDARGARYVGGFPHSVEIEEVASGTFARGGLLNKILTPLHIAGGVIGAVLRMGRDTPDAVVGFGGYPTIPALSAAWILRRPRMVHEQNGVLGRVNAIFAPRVDVVGCGIWPTDLPAGAEGLHVGNPVRAAVLERAGAAYIPREEDLDRVRRAYAGAGIDADVQPFFRDVPARMSEAQLVISRAGASSIADISVIGRPAILIPYAAAASDHQTANARGLVTAGGAIRIPESTLDAASLSAQISSVLGDAQGANLMAQAALGQGLPDAPQKLADLVEELAWKPDPRKDTTR